jgi:hypothetical protein
MSLTKFTTWLKSKTSPVILFAHNVKSFDCKRLIYHLLKHDLLSDFQSSVVCFVDNSIFV